MAKTIVEIRNEYLKEVTAFYESIMNLPLNDRPAMPEKLQMQKRGFDIIDSVNANSSMFEYLKARSMVKYGNYSHDKERIIKETVQELQSTAKNASQPGLLLGKIQSGKTDTFVSIIGLAFDEFFDVAIVTTKGTNTLATQTIKRLRGDFEDLIRIDRVAVYDVLDDLKDKKLNKYDINDRKLIIVCKKEDDNLKALIKLFEKNPDLKEKKVLLVDDEADFGSRNYMVRKGEVDLQVNSKLIEKFSKLPDYFRYLQVTATPYSLFLQPDGTVKTKDGDVSSFKPRFTKLVPVHANYVGGNEYFVEGLKPESMYFNMYTELTKDLVEKRLTDRNTFFTKPKAGKKSFESPSIRGLVQSLLSYFMSVAIRQYQEEQMYRNEKFEVYKSCALFHLDTVQEKHEWQKELIEVLVKELRDELRDKDCNNVHPLLKSLEVETYEGFKEANEKGLAANILDVELPDFDIVHNTMARILDKQNYTIKMVNSSKEGRPEINEADGQLILDKAANIFIGGSILDRGITIEHILCFFYGRDPKKMQMDTVLQHARMYGNRSKRDMAVTKFYTTRDIYNILVRMHEVDEALRRWIEEGRDMEDPGKIFLGVGRGFTPCASQKIRVANTYVLKHYMTILPKDFQTLPKKYMEGKMQKLDAMIQGHSKYAGNKSFFTMDTADAFQIIRAIKDTYTFAENPSKEWDVNDMLAAIQYATKDSEGKLYCWYAENRNAVRIKLDGGFNDPYDGKEELPIVREMAENMPVLMLLRENGSSEKGWKNTPFYWPVLVLQRNLEDVVFTLNNQIQLKIRNSADREAMLKGIKEDEFFEVTIKEDFFNDILSGDKIYEYRELKDKYVSTFLEYSDKKKKILALADDSCELNAGIHTYNHGVFPFVLKKYKYILLASGQTGNQDYALVRLADPKDWEVTAKLDTTDDDYTDRNGREHESRDEDFCLWNIGIKLDRVVRKAVKPKKKE